MLLLGQVDMMLLVPWLDTALAAPTLKCCFAEADDMVLLVVTIIPSDDEVLAPRPTVGISSNFDFGDDWEKHPQATAQKPLLSVLCMPAMQNHVGMSLTQEVEVTVRETVRVVCAKTKHIMEADLTQGVRLQSCQRPNSPTSDPSLTDDDVLNTIENG